MNGFSLNLNLPFCKQFTITDAGIFWRSYFFQLTAMNLHDTPSSMICTELRICANNIVFFSPYSVSFHSIPFDTVRCVSQWTSPSGVQHIHWLKNKIVYRHTIENMMVPLESLSQCVYLLLWLLSLFFILSLHEIWACFAALIRHRIESREEKKIENGNGNVISQAKINFHAK